VSAPRRSFAAAAFDVLASLKLSVVVLALLLLLTVLGTLEQTQSSLYEVQRRYFESMFVMHDVAGVPVPLPGVYLLLIVLFVNLVCGGIVRMRKDRTTWGVLVAHVGIVMLLAGSAVEYACSQKGHATVAEGAEAAEFQSYYEWEIAIGERRDDGRVAEHVIPGERFMHLAKGERARFTNDALPFDLVVHDPSPNCAPREDDKGVTLVDLPRSTDAERDEAGAFVVVEPKAAGAQPTAGVVWSRERGPMSVDVAGRRFTIGLSHRRWPLPFSVRLDEFRRQMHPGTGMAKAFESDVTKLAGGVPQRVTISMNQPLRQSGYTLYQSGFREPSTSGGRWWSTFSVVRNPADQVPLWASIVMTAGLLLHFTQKLLRHVRRQRGALA
jgi:hypothetical protein